MRQDEKIDIEIIKVVTRAIAGSGQVEVMAHHLTQLLVAALEIKGCTLFALNPESLELEPMASFGLSVDYLNKGPVLLDKSIDGVKSRKPVVVKNVKTSKRLQYTREAEKEGIGSIISLPVLFNKEMIGSLRLYHHEPWSISKKDLDSLSLLAETIGMAMMFTRLRHLVQGIQGVIWELPKVLLEEQG
ncbi:MAG: GAF domain-containing protein [Deltaproteobacteria bacterium]|nr:GAF domain-containing protein [Deltaproteobacteria bacterium]MBW1955769.1 GAF domain-containing protein [Deltaproteobacteria bacterium]MBW2041089.1 GAF domain-containing protein [Deltaproteobacteria bacterium]MBW2132237.1 GAF domain-containing protein [Deltaproteobacteria bacterium]